MRNRYEKSRGSYTSSTLHSGAKASDSHKKWGTVNKNPWTDERSGRLLKSELPGLAFNLFLRNPIAVAWLPVTVAFLWTLLWVLLVEFGVLVLPTVDLIFVATIMGALAFFAVFVFTNAVGKRSNNIRNMKSLISACVNVMSAIVSGLDYAKAEANPNAKVFYHTGAKYAESSESVSIVLDQINELLRATLFIQRNVVRGGFNPKRMPLDPDLVSSVIAQELADPLVSTQTMIHERFVALRKLDMFASDKQYHNFYKDLVDSQGNTAIDAAAGQAPAIDIFGQFFLWVVIIAMPFLLIPTMPGFFVLLVAVAEILFVAALLSIASKITDIYVSSRDNTWSGYNLIQEIRVGAREIDNLYKVIWYRIYATDRMPEPPKFSKKKPAAATPPPASTTPVVDSAPAEPLPTTDTATTASQRMFASFQ